MRMDFTLGFFFSRGSAVLLPLKPKDRHQSDFFSNKPFDVFRELYSAGNLNSQCLWLSLSNKAKKIDCLVSILVVILYVQYLKM